MVTKCHVLTLKKMQVIGTKLEQCTKCSCHNYYRHSFQKEENNNNVYLHSVSKIVGNGTTIDHTDKPCH